MVNVNKLMRGCCWLCVVGVLFLNAIVECVGWWWWWEDGGTNVNKMGMMMMVLVGKKELSW